MGRLRVEFAATEALVATPSASTPTDVALSCAMVEVLVTGPVRPRVESLGVEVLLIVSGAGGAGETCGSGDGGGGGGVRSFGHAS